MKKIVLASLIVFALFAAPALAATKSNVPAGWKPAAPAGYTPITWAQAPGIASFFRAPANNGSLDFITRIYLPQNRIEFIFSTSTPLDSGPAGADFVATDSVEQIATTSAAINSLSVASSSAAGYRNFSFARLVPETAKQLASQIKFLWDAPFFNMKSPYSDLSMALKYSVGTSTFITSGSRSVPDMQQDRRMLIINNQAGTSSISEFDAKKFVNNKIGDQAIEGFSPSVAKSDSAGGTAARLFLGVSNNGKELIIYCSQSATVGEASAALAAAGVTPVRQLEADGGGSASCGYNLPGQYFVEPNRTLPVMMGAMTILARGTVPGSSLNVRGGAGTKFKIVTKLSRGALVQVYEEKNGWYRIGANQWVLGSLIKKI